MDINSLIDRAHKNALAHGFYEDDFNLARSIMLIVSEIGEAMDSDRRGRIGEVSEAERYIDNETSDEYFEAVIKNTFWDEIADIFIRIFDLMGHDNIPFVQGDMVKSTGLYNDLRLLTLAISSGCVTKALHRLQALCTAQDIDIEPFILAKMKYNENRPYKHGKIY